MDPLSIGSGVMGALGGALGFFSQQDTNKTNAGIAHDTNVANVALSKEQMDFQERMSNTAHVRERADLKAAGYNPILGASKGGASSPSGSMPTLVAPQMENSAKAGMESAAQMSAMLPQVSNTIADTASKLQSAKLAGIQTESTAKDVEKKAIDNSYQGLILGQQLKKGGMDINTKGLENSFLENTLGNRIYQADSDASAAGSKAHIAGLDANMSQATYLNRLKLNQLETARQGAGLRSDQIGLEQDKQNLMYGNMQERVFESMGLSPDSSAKGSAENFLKGLGRTLLPSAPGIARKIITKGR